jgi:hypothetical protein
MPQIELAIEDERIVEEWDKFHKWARESRQLEPFLNLALDWLAGHLTIAEGRRIEREQQIAKFLSR